jgi:serine phosphatase RsbU (regulator of sigma subunit)
VADSIAYASTVRPFPGQVVSGDATLIRELEQGLFVAIVDVLGHGPEAHELTVTIDAYLSRYACFDLAGLIGRLHTHLKGSRGAAVGLCAIDPDAGSLEYTGIGNTAIRRFGSAESRLVSQDGVLGQNMRSPVPQQLQLESGDLVLLYTDGVSDRFTASDYPGLAWHSPQEVVSKTVQRFGKDHDDAACIAVRYKA